MTCRSGISNSCYDRMYKLHKFTAAAQHAKWQRSQRNHWQRTMLYSRAFSGQYCPAMLMYVVTVVAA